MKARMNLPALTLAWRQLRRDLKSGDIRILLAALTLAVFAVTAVGFVTDRAERALAIEANRLMGGDAVVRGDAPIDGRVRDAANASGLRSTETVELNSMIRVARAGVDNGGGDNLRLGDLRALGPGFPLRGAFRLRDARGVEGNAGAIPARGTVWMSRAGADTLGAAIGDTVRLGESSLRLSALVTQEPDASLDYFNVAPKVFLNLADLPATGLVQEGSRVGYRLVVAGEAGPVERFVATARAALGRGQRLETIGQARPEIRSALERAGRFLGLAALVSVVLAA
ncbi:MAG TPA: permease, partial [Lysobacter sp.]|nr:permease [Lysobacter sp.]